jgi:predicted aminopeptidase
VIWNVVAAPAFSLTLKTWCFPVTGCIGYRGYYDEAEARELAAQLRAEGYESDAYPVPAYSTLGWMNWAGGDPLLNTFINYPEGELARTIFHELAHQVVYAKDDTMFNESFATAVERLGVQRWLREQASEPARADYARYDERRQQFRALTQGTRKELQAAYDTKAPLSQEERARRKAEIMDGSGPTTPACARAGTSTPRACACWTNGWRRRTTRPSARRPRTTTWCPASKACSPRSGATGAGSMMKRSGWPPCPRTNATAP